MKIIITFFVSVFLFTSLYSQNPNSIDKSKINFYGSRLSECINNKNADSAIFFINKLSENNIGTITLQNYLHNSLAFDIWGLHRDTDLTKTCTKVFKAIHNQHDQRSSTICNPIYFSSLIEETQNEDQLKKIINLFWTQYLNKKDLFNNYIITYALLIYTASTEKHIKSIDPLLTKYLDFINQKLLAIIKSKSRKSGITDEAFYWYQWMYCCANYFKAKSELASGRIANAEQYFKTASDFSLDIWNLSNSLYYFRDMILLVKGEKSFTLEYLNYLKVYGKNKEVLLNAYLKESITNPDKKNELKAFYNSNFSDRVPFDTFWLQSINHIALNASEINSTTIDNNNFSLLKQKGKWVLIDFWGTWCEPCRKEHPVIEKFYKEFVQRNQEKISLMTIACKDTTQKVIRYMQDMNFSFPVIIADSVVEKKFKITSYPSKVLVTPQGKYILIEQPPLDWKNLVEKYIN